jgi:N-dimethylarginine dimethylaminohydrolase
LTAGVTAWSSSECLTFAEESAAMTDQRMALLARLEQAARSTEPDVVREALRWAIEALMPYARAVSENLPWRLPTE